MKFSTLNLLTLLSVGSALSFTFENELIMNNHLFARDDQVVDTVTQLQCQAAVNTSNCLSQQTDLKNIDYDELCKPLKDEKCTKLFTEGISDLDGCKKLPAEILETTNKQLKINQSVLKILCEKDEEGKECPFTSYIKSSFTNLNNIEDVDNNEIEKLFDETCKSQRCSENTSNYLLDSIELMEMVMKELEKQDPEKVKKEKEGNKLEEKKQKIKDRLLGDKCVKAHVLKSDATSTIKKLGSTMLITVSLLLYLLN